MTLDPAAVSALRATINARYAELRSWRKVQKQYYPRVAFGTLQRIACSDYLPKDPKILRALGLTGQGRRAKEYRSVTESLCEDCGEIWTGKAAHRDGREHAERSRHRVRVTQTIMRVYEVKNED